MTWSQHIVSIHTQASLGLRKNAPAKTLHAIQLPSTQVLTCDIIPLTRQVLDIVMIILDNLLLYCKDYKVRQPQNLPYLDLVPTVVQTMRESWCLNFLWGQIERSTNFQITEAETSSEVF